MNSIKLPHKDGFKRQTLPPKLPPKKIDINEKIETISIDTDTLISKAINAKQNDVLKLPVASKVFKLPEKKVNITLPSRLIIPVLNKLPATKELAVNPALVGELLPARNILDTNQLEVFDSHGNSKIITLNAKQLEFKKYIEKSISCCLIGAAGTGKTTCTNAGIQALINTGSLMPMTMTHKYIPVDALGIVICAYTRRAVQNIKRQISGDISKNCITIHKLLEYQPVKYECVNEETGQTYTKRIFEPKRTANNPLDRNLKVIVIDESSMLSVDLWEKLIDALPNYQAVTFIFIGDINQLPPTFGRAILGYKLNELPVIELDEVYRQALESPALAFAHRILSGKPIQYNELSTFNVKDKLQIVQYPRKLPAEKALLEAVKMFKSAYDSGAYNPEEHTILIPQVNYRGNEKYSYAAVIFNKYLASHIAKANNREVFEVIAGYTTFYFSVGDYVVYDKQDAKIISIEKNTLYIGKPYQESSLTLDYFGYDSGGSSEKVDNSSFDIDKLLEMSIAGENEGEKLELSHAITIQLIDSDVQLTIETVGGIKALDLAYAGSVHRAQGSEWSKVFLLIHHSHNVLVNRELLYTAVTRVRDQLIILCEGDTFNRGINCQAIKGNTLAEKAEWFKGKQ